MKHIFLCFVFTLVCVGCYQREDPMVRAARDLQRMAEDFASYEENRIQRFRSLQLGMSANEVQQKLGPPASQQLLESNENERREIWTYQGAVRPLGTLTFKNGRLVEIHAE